MSFVEEINVPKGSIHHSQSIGRKRDECLGLIELESTMSEFDNWCSECAVVAIYECRVEDAIRELESPV